MFGLLFVRLVFEGMRFVRVVRVDGTRLPFEIYSPMVCLRSVRGPNHTNPNIGVFGVVAVSGFLGQRLQLSGAFT